MSVKNCWEFFNCKSKEGCIAYKYKRGADCWNTIAGDARKRCKEADARGIKDCTECEWYKKNNAQ